MGMVSTNEFRKKLKLLLDGQPWIIVENQFVKPGKGQAFNRVKVKNMLTGRVVENTWKSGEKFEEAEVSSASMTYLYNDTKNWSFMDTETYETIEVPKEAMGGAEKWLLDNTPVDATLWDGRIISVEPPTFMNLLVVEAPPGKRGDTSGRVMRPAKLETGAEVQIPLFIDEGVRIKVDTRTGEYVEKAKD